MCKTVGEWTRVCLRRLLNMFRSFKVPLDYSNPSGEKAAIAIARLPAKVAPTDPAYRGPVLFNPGTLIRP
jgi:hypothetical protein